MDTIAVQERERLQQSYEYERDSTGYIRQQVFCRDDVNAPTETMRLVNGVCDTRYVYSDGKQRLRFRPDGSIYHEELEYVKIPTDIWAEVVKLVYKHTIDPWRNAALRQETSSQEG